MPSPCERVTPRIDGKPGYRTITPTKMGFFESDGTDVRMDRVRVFDPHGNVVHIYLCDTMGVPFKDMPLVPDDPLFTK